MQNWIIPSRHFLIMASSSTNPDAARQAHNASQADYFRRELKALRNSITPKVEEQLAIIAESVPGLGPCSRILDAGAGDGALIPHLQHRGVRDMLAVDVCPAMLQALRSRVNGGETRTSTLGNEPAVRIWEGDVIDIPAYQGPFDAAFFNAVLGNVYNQSDTLLKTCFMLRPGAHIVISHPLGRTWLDGYRQQNPDIVPHALPNRTELEQLIHALPLEVVDFQDSNDLYVAVLRVPEGYALRAGPVHLRGHVTTGFGRGSKQLGVPTANIPPEPLRDQLSKLPNGVYFGWAQVDLAAHEGDSTPEADSKVHKMVLNVGRRPTFEDKEPELTVEVHIMHHFASDFYGMPLKVIALGYVRPEIRFSGVQELLARIHADIGIARTQLDLPMWSKYARDKWFDKE